MAKNKTPHTNNKIKNLYPNELHTTTQQTIAYSIAMLVDVNKS